jgi:hypothetical protein
MAGEESMRRFSFEVAGFAKALADRANPGKSKAGTVTPSREINAVNHPHWRITMTSLTRKTFARYALISCAVLIGGHSFAAQSEDFQQQVRQSILGAAYEVGSSKTSVTGSRSTTGAHGIDMQQQARQSILGQPRMRDAAAAAQNSSGATSSITCSTAHLAPHAYIEGSVRSVLTGKGK